MCLCILFACCLERWSTVLATLFSGPFFENSVIVTNKSSKPFLISSLASDAVVLIFVRARSLLFAFLLLRVISDFVQKVNNYHPPAVLLCFVPAATYAFLRQRHSKEVNFATNRVTSVFVIDGMGQSNLLEWRHCASSCFWFPSSVPPCCHHPYSSCSSTGTCG